jgi:hypothetical protein
MVLHAGLRTEQLDATHVYPVSVPISRQDISWLYFDHGNLTGRSKSACYLDQYDRRPIVTSSQKLVGMQYSWVSSFFYVGFLAVSPLASILLVRFSVVKVVAVTV